MLRAHLESSATYDICCNLEAEMPQLRATTGAPPQLGCFRSPSFFRLLRLPHQQIPACILDPERRSCAIASNPANNGSHGTQQHVPRPALVVHSCVPPSPRPFLEKLTKTTPQETTALSPSSAAVPVTAAYNFPATPLTSQTSTLRRSVNSPPKPSLLHNPAPQTDLQNQYDGYIAPQAIGVQPGNENRGVTLLTKKISRDHKPASSLQIATFGSNTSTRKTYRSIVNSTARKSYRPDLRREAVARASAIRRAQKPKPNDRPVKLRGAKARKAAKGSKA